MHDVWLHIFSWLPIEDLWSVGRVSREFNAYSAHDSLWRAHIQNIFGDLNQRPPPHRIRRWLVNIASRQALTTQNFAQGHMSSRSLASDTQIRCMPVIFYFDGQPVVAYTKEKTVCIQNPNDKQNSCHRTSKIPFAFSLAPFKRRGIQYLGIGTMLGELLLWNLNSGKITRRWHSILPIIDLLYDEAKGGRLIWRDQHSNIHLLPFNRAENGIEFFPSLRHPCLSFTALDDGHVVATAYTDLIVWNSDQPQKSQTMERKHKALITQLVYEAHSHTLVSADTAGVINFWDTRTFEHRVRIWTQYSDISALSLWHLGGSYAYLTVGTDSGYLHIWKSRGHVMEALCHCRIGATILSITPLQQAGKLHMILQVAHVQRARGKLRTIALKHSGELIIQSWNSIPRRTRRRRVLRRLFHRKHVQAGTQPK